MGSLKISIPYLQISHVDSFLPTPAWYKILIFWENPVSILIGTSEYYCTQAWVDVEEAVPRINPKASLKP